VNGRSTAPLEIELLPARHGDSILLSWGPATDRHRLLVDGGPASAYDAVGARMAEVAQEGHLDLLVLTHIDADHIEGTILLTNDAGVGIGIDEVWFNGPGQLSDELSAAQGEMFAALVGARRIPMNAAFGEQPIRVPDDGLLPTRTFAGLQLTVLGPDRQSLLRLRDSWTGTCEDEGFVFATAEEALVALRRRRRLNADDVYLDDEPMPRSDEVSDLARQVVATDTSVPNASSIVLLAEYDGSRVLLAGDATPDGLTAGVRRLLAERHLDRLDLDVLKVPHHGSTRNLTRELLSLAPADHYLFSSDGSRFGHPDRGGVAKCLEFGKPGAELVFNYRSPQTLAWDEPELLASSIARFPDEGKSGVRLPVPARRPEVAS
jgi:hypothetical protein